MFNEDKSVAVVCNGEIYNFRELKHGLEQKGHRFATSCDTEVIPHLYEEYGLDFPEHLVGMFALAVWDRRVKRLMLVLDRMGIKPLYYAETAGGLVFASELRAVLAAGKVPLAFDEESFDEGPSARMVAAHLGGQHDEERRPVGVALQLLPRLADIMDEPLGDPAILPTYLLSRAARTRVVVALSGEGGDELFYGYPTYYAHRVARLLERSPRIVSGAVRALVGRLPASSSNFALDFVAKRFASGVGRNLAERHRPRMSSFEPDKGSPRTAY